MAPRARWGLQTSLILTVLALTAFEVTTYFYLCCRIAVYKALYKLFGGFVSDVIAAIDQVLLQYISNLFCKIGFTYSISIQYFDLFAISVSSFIDQVRKRWRLELGSVFEFELHFSPWESDGVWLEFCCFGDWYFLVVSSFMYGIMSWCSTCSHSSIQPLESFYVHFVGPEQKKISIVRF